MVNAFGKGNVGSKKFGLITSTSSTPVLGAFATSNYTIKLRKCRGFVVVHYFFQ